MKCSTIAIFAGVILSLASRIGIAQTSDAPPRSAASPMAPAEKFENRPIRGDNSVATDPDTDAQRKPPSNPSGDQGVGPLDTKSGGAPPQSPQGDAPPGMQPGDSSANPK